ncbi:hypothetical protein LZC95_45645 [Pendulispora brunnea]|uniref:Uncharacterized protein n=1 Tax=Pendulispora brunnea TaxID=2905690 RepID=A0ABZ2KBG4_9BACT
MRKRVALGVALLVVGVLAFSVLYRPFPSDRTPEGAYMRIARAVTDDRLTDMFPYLETDAQWASYTIRDMRAKACTRIRGSYPEPERSRMLAAYEPQANVPDGADVFALLARQRGWVARLRKDLSGVVRTEIDGDRASVVTARGTRYPFHRRDNGIWGLTIFTPELIAESERASRDLAVVTSAADDYGRAGDARRH